MYFKTEDYAKAVECVKRAINDDHLVIHLRKQLVDLYSSSVNQRWIFSADGELLRIEQDPRLKQFSDELNNRINLILESHKMSGVL